MNLLLDSIIFNIVKYNPADISKYLVKINLNIDWKKLYYFLYKENEISAPHTYPSINENPWLNAIINRNAKISGKKVFYGTGSFVKLLKNGTIKSKGFNTSGQLGLCHYKYTLKYKLVKNIKNVKNIFIGYNYILLLLKNSLLLVSGCGDYFRGSSNYNTTSIFTPIKNVKGKLIKNIYKVFNYQTYTFLLLNNGEIMSSGNNSYGQIGLGNTENQYYYETICDENNNPIKDVVNVFLGNQFTCILLKNGTVMVCGYNEFSNLGLNRSDNLLKFTLIPNINNIKDIHITPAGLIILVLENNKLLMSTNQTGYQPLDNPKLIRGFGLEHLITKTN